MKRFVNLKSAFAAVLLLLMGSLTAFAAIPNPYRGYAATWFDMEEIAPGIFIDDVSKKALALALVKRARKRVGVFYGKVEARPRILLCTTKPCHETFGGGARGTSYGATLLRVGPRGFNETILTHELFHAELHHKLHLLGMLTNQIPVWFNEGIATYYSRDDRFSFDHDGETKRWIRSAQSHFGDWGNYATREKWKIAYGSAAANIKDLDKAIGSEGLRDLINAVTKKGRDFEEVLSEIERDIADH